MNSLLRAVLQLAEWFPLSITSWVRTPARNAAVGGHPRSLHLNGLALDVVYDFGSGMPEVRSLQSWLNSQGLEVLRETSHDHIQVRTADSPTKWHRGD